MHLGLSEIIVIVLVLIILVKPDKISEYASTLGKTVKEFNEAKNNVNKDILEVDNIVKGKEE